MVPGARRRGGTYQLFQECVNEGVIIPNVAPPEPFYNIPYEYGAFYMWGAIWWADVLESNATADATGAMVSRILTKRYGEILRSLPVVDLDKAVLGKENPYWRAWIDHPTEDAYWQGSLFWAGLERARIPVFHQSGYPIDLWQTAFTIDKGSRLRVEVSSAAFPLFSRNLNTGGHNEKETRFVTARQTVFHNARYPSHLLLPVIPEQMLQAAK